MMMGCCHCGENPSSSIPPSVPPSEPPSEPPNPSDSVPSDSTPSASESVVSDSVNRGCPYCSGNVAARQWTVQWDLVDQASPDPSIPDCHGECFTAYETDDTVVADSNPDTAEHPSILWGRSSADDTKGCYFRSANRALFTNNCSTTDTTTGLVDTSYARWEMQICQVDTNLWRIEATCNWHHRYCEDPDIVPFANYHTVYYKKEFDAEPNCLTTHVLDIDYAEPYIFPGPSGLELYGPGNNIEGTFPATITLVPVIV